MSLKSILLGTRNAPRRCLVWLIIITAFVAFIALDGMKYDLKTDGPMLALDGGAVMRQRFDQDTINTRLAAGDSVKVLGIDRSSSGQKWLVETRRGDIGWIDASDLSGVRQIIVDGSDKGDTVSVKAKWLDAMIYRYVYKNGEGEETERSTSGFMPAFDGWDDYAYDRDSRAGVCTQSKFENKTIGKSLAEINRSFGHPVLLRVTSQGFEAQYSWKAFDPSTGTMWLPDVTFGADSVAVAVSFVRPTERAAGWLKILPFASAIIDCPLTTVAIRSGRYIANANPMPEGMMKVVMYCMIPIVLFAYFLWMFASQTVPVLLMGWLMAIPPLFAWLNDKWLRALMLVLTVVSCYVWVVIMMAWGMFPFWAILIVVIGWYAFSLASSPLCTYPHCRCPQCHHMYTIKFDYDEFEYDEIATGSDVVRGKLLGKRTEKWKTWTRITTTTTDRFGNKSTSNRDVDVQKHSLDYNTYEFIDYKVTYRLDHYTEYYKCRVCGFIETQPRVDWTEIDREQVGTHTAEIAGQERVRSW